MGLDTAYYFKGGNSNPRLGGHPLSFAVFTCKVEGLSINRDGIGCKYHVKEKEYG